MIFSITFLLIFTLYFGVILWALWGMQQLKKALEKQTFLEPTTGFSIIIPFKEEAKNIPALVASLQQLNYPNHLFEIICVDDHSSDDGVAIFTESLQKSPLNYLILQGKDENISSKKEAITLGVSKAKHPWVITTDADCQVPPQWLESFNAVIVSNNNLAFLAAPVVCPPHNSLLSQYQFLDVLSLQGLTMAGFGHYTPFLCNGANLAYTKELFYTVKGFNGNIETASGDDVFMLQKALNHVPKKIGYVYDKSATVATNPVITWKHLIRQRIRWASKTGKQKNPLSTFLGVLLVTMSSFLVFIVPAYFLGWVGYALLITLGILKVAIDLIFLKRVGRFFKQPISVGYFLVCFLIYPFINIAVVWGSFFLKSTWKERRV